jgi:hypothetical protein
MPKIVWEDGSEERVRREVASFCSKMERKLKANEHKGGWKDCEVTWLRQRLGDELCELDRAIKLLDLDRAMKLLDLAKLVNYPEELAMLTGVRRKVRRSDVGEECTDIANLAMMIDDVAGEL